MSFCDELLETFDYAWKFRLGTHQRQALSFLSYSLHFLLMRAEFVVCIIKEKDQTLDVLVYGWQSPTLPWRAGADMGMQLCRRGDVVQPGSCLVVVQSCSCCHNSCRVLHIYGRELDELLS